MIKIGILSDTHSFLDDKIFEYFKTCDEIWHAGDVGALHIVDQLKAFKPCRMVFGNIDNKDIRLSIPEYDIFHIEEVKVMIIHIAGKFGTYSSRVQALLKEHKPQLLVCGHSHILKIAYDSKWQLLYLNPGAFGIHGIHTVRTLLRFNIHGKDINGMEIIERPRSIKVR